MADSNLFETTVGKRQLLLKTTVEQETKLFDEMYRSRKKQDEEANKHRLDQQQKLQNAILQLEKKRINQGLNDTEEAAYLAAETQLKVLSDQAKKQEAEIEKIRNTARHVAQQRERNSYQTMSNDRKRAYHKEIADQLKETEVARRKEIAAEQLKQKKLQESYDKAVKKYGVTSAQAKRFKTQLDNSVRKETDLNKQQEYMRDAEKRSRTFGTAELLASPEARKSKRSLDLEANNTRLLNNKATIQIAKQRKKEIQEEWKNSEKSKKIQDQINKAKQIGDQKTAKRLEEEYAKQEEIWKTKKGYLEEEQLLNNEIAEAIEDQKQAKKDAVRYTLADTASVALGEFVDKTADRLSSHLDDMYGSQGRMKGRLQGSGVNWGSSLLDVTSNVGLSGLVSQKKIVKKMEELVDSGVAYNLELRAFLAETSENIASTFDAANGTLLRMIRLQQADTTAARLGMEATLTKLFNQYFKDTSYLTQSGPSDAITSAIMDASATMSRDQSLEFEFTVQKWLGSLYSLGMSTEAVQQIAEGINYLGTGNVTALNNNPALQTLFAMSASRAGGKSYAQMLTTGLTNEDTNKLLKAMIEYLAQIAESQTNFVTKAAYADLFNMSITDLSAFSSLTTEEIENLFKTNTDYKTLTKETENQLKQVITRVSMAQMLDTVIENAEVGAASLIGSNPITYGTWKALSILKDYVGKVEIPGITVAGFGLASGMDLLNLAQTAMAGLGLVGSLISGVASMAQGGAMNLNAWNYEEYTQRGGGLPILKAGSGETTSYSAMLGVGGGSGEDIETVTMESGKDKGTEAAGTTSEEMEEQKEIPQKIYDALAGASTTTVLSLLQEIDDRLDPSRVFYTAISGVLSRDTVSQVTNLSAQLATAKAKIESVNEQGSTNNEQIKSATGVTVSSTQSQTFSNVSSQALSGNGTSPVDGSVVDLSSIIADAVATALNNVLASNSYSGIPVRVTNGG